MKTLCASLLVLLLTAAAAAAEPTFQWHAHQTLAARLSDGLVAAAIAAESLHSWKQPDRGRAFKNQACRVALTFGVTEAVKRLVGRERPDGSDNESFWSGHSATAMSAAGWRYEIGVPIALGAGYFRMAANRHYLTDIIAGQLAGLAASRACP